LSQHFTAELFFPFFSLGSAEPVEDEKPVTSIEQSDRKAPRVKALSADDLDKYTIFDVIMPLPGTDVAYPEGELGKKYREFLRLDGLDPNNFHRKQRWALSHVHHSWFLFSSGIIL
jgi:tRNA pseudouridine13 synthase